MGRGRRPERLNDERGYLMVALLVAMSIMAILASAALPAWSTLARREKEAELVFRGEQYARAIGLWQRRFANQPAPSVDVLVEQRFLRKKYKDPITNDEFQVLGAGTPLPGQTPEGGSPSARGGQVWNPLAPSGFQSGAGRGGAVVGGVVGVTSKSAEKSLRLYNGRDAYNQWVFMPTAQSARVGGEGGEAGGRGTEGRAGRAGRGGGDGRGGIDLNRGFEGAGRGGRGARGGDGRGGRGGDGRGGIDLNQGFGGGRGGRGRDGTPRGGF